MRPISRAAVSRLLGIGFVVSAVCNTTASAMSVPDLPSESAIAFVVLPMVEDARWTAERILSIGGELRPACVGVSATWGSITDDARALKGTAFGMGVPQSDTVSDTVVPPIERDLCADAWAARTYWCDRASGPDGTQSDMDNCRVWDQMASFLCYFGAGVDGAAGPPAIRRVIALEWVMEYPTTATWKWNGAL